MRGGKEGRRKRTARKRRRKGGKKEEGWKAERGRGEVWLEDWFLFCV
jgi:hypothetical protein